MSKCGWCGNTILFGGEVADGVHYCNQDCYKNSKKSPEERQAESVKRQAELTRQASLKAQSEWGLLNPAMVCPHCQTKGQVRTKWVKRKKGVSGAKATGALLTGGMSLFVTGLSRKEGCTQAHCDSCNCTWDF